MPFGYMYTQKEYSDCILELEWRWDGEASNSGIFLLIADPTNPFPNGIECQLKAGSAGDFVMLGGSSLAEYEAPEGGPTTRFPVIKKRDDSSENPTGEWNKARIEITEGFITVDINGVFQNHGTNKVTKGYIGLQSEGGKVRFRNVVVTPK
jgi:hypothetical protein